MHRSSSQDLTPSQIARMVTEDSYGLPLSMPESPVIAHAPLSNFNDSGEHAQNTMLRGCSAERCANNDGGKCNLEMVDINQYGGCTQYEAAAGGSDDGQGRYEEDEDYRPLDDSDDVASKPVNQPLDPNGTGAY